MKYIKNNTVFVQYKDLYEIAKKEIDVPGSLIDLLSTDEHILGNEEEYKNQFVCLKGEEFANFFETVDWIVDYESLLSFTTTDVIKLMNQNVEKQATYIKDVDIDGEESVDLELLEKRKKLKYQLNDYLVFLNMLSGHWLEYLHEEMPKSLNAPDFLIRKLNQTNKNENN